jgi:hypothetical protein
MRWLCRFLVVLVSCLIAVALPFVPAQAACVPYSIELSPKSGVPGTELTVYGHDFTAGKLVDIYYDGTRSATNRTDANGEFTLAFTIPEGCTGQYQVLADLGYTTVDTYFIVRPGLMVSPEKGPVGTNVTVKGRGFAKNEQDIDLRYYLNGSNYETIDRHILANTRGSWEISFPIPPSTRGELKLDAQGHESQLVEVKDATFRVTAEISLDKSSGIVGDSVTMRGSAFTAYEKGIQILFDGETALTGINADGQGYWEESFKVPEMASGTYNVTAGGAMTPREDTVAVRFEIKPGIVLPPGEGHVGMNLTVTGHGFAASTDVIIMYDGSQKATATTSDKGSFDNASFLVPESSHGEHRVAAGYAGENHASAILTVESDPPPIPTLISPFKGSWVGFTGSASPTFRWSAVSDESGVRYRLQIATSGNITTTGEFVDPIVSVKGLVGTNYTMEETEALPDGTYYWIVQAVDGAENESPWSTAYSFRVGLLPKWAFIVSIVAIVVLVGALVYFFVIRRRIHYYE